MSSRVGPACYKPVRPRPAHGGPGCRRPSGGQGQGTYYNVNKPNGDLSVFETFSLHRKRSDGHAG